MSAYVVTHVRVHDADEYEGFLAAAMPLFKKWGGEIVVGSAECTALEGECPSRVVVQKFPDADSAQGFYESEERRNLRAATSECCTFHAILLGDDA